jgi:AcrR family transcriptional regulator
MTATVVRRRQEERVALSDERMLRAAVELLVEYGIAGTTLAAVGERAGYSRGLPAYRFGSKAGLLAHVHDTVADEWIARAQAAVGDRIGIEALEGVVDALCRFIADAPDELRAMYLLRYSSIDPASEYRANIAKVHKAQWRDARCWIEAGQTAGQISKRIDAALAAQLFCATADGLLYRWLVTPALPLVKLHRMLRREVRHSLSASRPGAGALPRAVAARNRR